MELKIYPLALSDYTKELILCTRKIAVQNKLLLHVSDWLFLAGTQMDIRTIRLHDTRLEVIAKIRFENFVADVTDHLGIFDRKQHFNSAVKVAGHQIGAHH